MTPILTLPLGLFIIIAALFMAYSLYFSYKNLMRRWLISFFRREPPRIVDVTKSDIDIPMPVLAATLNLEELGFQQCAVSEVHLPQHRVVGITWHYINSERDINVELIKYKNKAAVQFTTWYNDDTVIETSYPIGENFGTKTYRRRFSRSSISDAYWIHREQMRKLTEKKFLVPKPIRSIGEYISDYQAYQTRFAPYKFLPGLLRGTGRFIAINVIAATFLLLVAIYAVPDLHFQDPTLTGIIALAIGGLAAITYKYLLARNKYHFDE